MARPKKNQQQEQKQLNNKEIKKVEFFEQVNIKAKDIIPNVKIFNKQSKMFTQRNYSKEDMRYTLYEREIYLISLPEEYDDIELVPQYKLLLEMEHYSGNTYMIAPRNTSHTVHINPNDVILKAKKIKKEG